jgi:hypothetical protein
MYCDRCGKRAPDELIEMAEAHIRIVDRWFEVDN